MEIPQITVGVVADTHLPDRSKKLPDGLIPGLMAAKVSLILHAGDVISPIVLDMLNEVAPVTAVKGNRDWALHLPLTRRLEIAGVMVGLAHGHGGWRLYWVDRVAYLFRGYQFERYRDQLQSFFPATHQDQTLSQMPVKVIVFGHTHVPLMRYDNGELFFNPGAALACSQNDFLPRFGLLHFYNGGKVEGEIRQIEVT
jgi:predicted phosphodiesterase